MEIFIETNRLILREIEFKDESDMFEMDSDPAVHRYIENKPVESIEEIRNIISILKNQYIENGIARWAVIDKSTNEFLGWSGLKYFKNELNNHSNFYELGYRFKQKHWGKGYATESSIAILNYGFKKFNIDNIYAITDPQNENSIHVLSKLGFTFVEVFDYDGDATNWFELSRQNWERSIFFNNEN